MGWRGLCSALICRIPDVCALVRCPVVARAQLSPRDGHLVQAGVGHVGREVNDATVVLHILEFVLLRRLHVDHRVLVYVLFQDYRLGVGGAERYYDLFYQTNYDFIPDTIITAALRSCD